MSTPTTKLPPEAKAKLEAYYNERGVKEDDVSRLKHFKTTYPDTSVRTQPPIETDEQELRAWEFLVIQDGL